MVFNICPYSDGPLLAQQKIMLESLSDKAAILKDIIERIGCQVVETHGLAKPLIHGTRSHVSIVHHICTNSFLIMLAAIEDNCELLKGVVDEEDHF